MEITIYTSKKGNRYSVHIMKEGMWHFQSRLNKNQKSHIFTIQEIKDEFKIPVCIKRLSRHTWIVIQDWIPI